MKRFLSFFLVVNLLVITFGSTFVSADWYYDRPKVNNYLKSTKINKLKSKAAILYDLDSDALLFKKSEDKKLSIASLTKVMSMLLIMEAIDSGKIKLNQKVTASENAYATEGSQVWLDVGEKFTVKELLESVAIHSANDSTVALAEAIAGSESGFVDMMNKKAKELGMTNTEFTDCVGLHDKADGHYSTASDLLKVSIELVRKHPKILDYTSIYRKLFRKGPKQVWLDNTNRMIFYYKGTLGLKTGFTTDAGYNFICVAKNNDKMLLSVILGAKDTNLRFAETIKLLDHGFNDFTNVSVKKKDEVVSSVKIPESEKTESNVAFNEDVFVTLDKSKSKKITTKVTLNEGIKAPVAKGTEIGKAEILNGKTVVKTVPVFATEDIARANVFVRFWRWILSLFGA